MQNLKNIIASITLTILQIMNLAAHEIEYCNLSVPLLGKEHSLTKKETKIINHTIKSALRALEKAQVLKDSHFCWKVPHATLHSCSIKLPTHTCSQSGTRICTNSPCGTIIIYNFEPISQSLVKELTQSFKEIEKEKKFFDQKFNSIVSWIDGFLLMHEKNNIKDGHDTIEITLKIESRADGLENVRHICNKKIADPLGIPKSLLPAHIPLAQIGNLKRSCANQLIEKLKNELSQVTFDKKTFRLRKFFLRSSTNCKKLINDPLEIRNFSHHTN